MLSFSCFPCLYSLDSTSFLEHLLYKWPCIVLSNPLGPVRLSSILTAKVTFIHKEYEIFTLKL